MSNAIVVMIDGLRPDAIAAAGCAIVPGLCQRGASTLAARSVMPSVTLPCHMSIFHSAFHLPRCGDQRLDAIELRRSASDFLDRIAAWMSPPAGRKLDAGSKVPQPKTVRGVAGAARTGKGVRDLWRIC